MIIKLDRLTLVSLLRPWLWFSQPLQLTKLNPNPNIEFARWFAMAQRLFWLEFPDAVCISSVNSAGRPDSRMVLLKGINPKGLEFYTNYNSAKGQQLESNNSASMTFFWDALQRQVRVRGSVEKLSTEESDRYFYSRSVGHRVSASLSKQSHVLSDGEQFHSQISESIENSGQESIKRPESWGGYRLVPDEFEFWKARRNRAHDRFLYTKAVGVADKWNIQQLFP
jgi:pyridoxamine 5'-phosphate oxidase